MSRKHADEIRRLVTKAAVVDGIVNVPVVARQIHDQHPSDYLFDIEQLVLGFAELSGVPIVFDLSLRASNRNDGIMLEFVNDDDTEISDELHATISGDGTTTSDLDS